MTAAAIGAVVARAGLPGLPGLPDVDRLTGESLRVRRLSDNRYERPALGDLVHVDVKKLGRISDGGGWRVHGRSEEVRGHGLGLGLRSRGIGDHTRLAYAEVLPDERPTTSAGLLTRAAARFADRGMRIARVLNDNAQSYRGCGRGHCLDQVGIVRRFSSPAAPGPEARLSSSTAPCWGPAESAVTDRARNRGEITDPTGCQTALQAAGATLVAAWQTDTTPTHPDPIADRAGVELLVSTLVVPQRTG